MRPTLSLLVPAVLALALGCQQSDFAGGAAKRSESPTDKKTDGGDSDAPDGNDANDSGTDSGKPGANGKTDGEGGLGNTVPAEDQANSQKTGTDSGLQTDEGETVQKPQQCTVQTVKFAPGAQGAACPAGYAAYSADDGNSPNFGCCPLPAKDILTKDPPQARGNACQANEVVTGTSGGGVLCSKINTKRYKLGPAQVTCYYGDGAAGGDGAQACGAPGATLQALAATMGSDACLGFPFGSLITARSGKECGDVMSAQLYFVDTNQPVKMYQ